MDAQEIEYYESLIQYYKTKCNQMEHDFVIHKIRSEQAIKHLNLNIRSSDLIAVIIMTSLYKILRVSKVFASKYSFLPKFFFNA